MSPEKRPAPYTEALNNFDLNDIAMLSLPVFMEDPAIGGFVRTIAKRQDRFEEGTDLHDAVAKAILETDAEKKSILHYAAGVDIAKSIINTTTTPRARIMGYLSACHQINRITVGQVEHVTSGASMNTIMHFVRQEIVGSLEPTDKTMKIVDVLNAILNETVKAEPNRMGWNVPKMNLFTQDVQARYYTAKLLGSETASSEQSTDTEVFKASKELMTKTLHKRRYGLKPAYTAASIGGSWIFHDGYGVADIYGDRMPIHDLQYVPMTAMILHSPDVTPKLLKLGVAKEIVTGGGATVGFEINSNTDARFYLGEDGELYSDIYGRFRLRDEPTMDITKLSAITAELVANFHDLTVPIAHIQKHGFRRAGEGNATMGQQSFDPLYDLLIPRLKALSNDTIQDKVEEQTKTIREHGVVWHIRTLPAGWKASPEAAVLAKAKGVHLKEGETFVKEHIRGKEHPLEGHKIVRRRAGGMALGATGLEKTL